MLKRASLALLSALLVGCTGDEPAPSTETYTANGTPARGDMVITANIGQASGLVPWLAGESAASEIANLVYRGVLKYTKDLALTGDLAKRWEVSAGGAKIRFFMDETAHWHDGTPVTAYDVEATFTRITDPATRTPYAANFKSITNFSVIDAHTFEITYEEPFSPALMNWAGFTVLPKHVLEKDEDFNETRLKHTALGNSFFKISERKPGQFTTFSAVRPNTPQEAWLNGWQIRVIPDQDTQFLELKAGTLDLMGLKPVQAARLSSGKRFNETFAKHSYLANGYTFVGFNLNHPILKEKLVRQALSYATPREQIVNAVLFGQGQPAVGPYKPGTWAYNQNLAPYPFNLDKAKALLTEAGFADSNNDGLLDRLDETTGTLHTFKIRLITNQGNDQRIKTAEILQHFWGKLGIKVEVEVQEWATFLENTLYPRDFDAFILGWNITPNPDGYIIWHSSQRGPRQFNVIDFNNSTVDSLLEEARRTFNRSEQKRLYDAFQNILHEEQPYLFLYVPTATAAVHKRIKNVTPAPAGITYNVEDWYVPTEQQLRLTP